VSKNTLNPDIVTACILPLRNVFVNSLLIKTLQRNREYHEIISDITETIYQALMPEKYELQE